MTAFKLFTAGGIENNWNKLQSAITAENQVCFLPERCWLEEQPSEPALELQKELTLGQV